MATSFTQVAHFVLIYRRETFSLILMQFDLSKIKFTLVCAIYPWPRRWRSRSKPKLGTHSAQSLSYNKKILSLVSQWNSTSLGRQAMTSSTQVPQKRKYYIYNWGCKNTLFFGLYDLQYPRDHILICVWSEDK